MHIWEFSSLPWSCHRHTLPYVALQVFSGSKLRSSDSSQHWTISPSLNWLLIQPIFCQFWISWSSSIGFSFCHPKYGVKWPLYSVLRIGAYGVTAGNWNCLELLPHVPDTSTWLLADSSGTVTPGAYMGLLPVSWALVQFEMEPIPPTQEFEHLPHSRWLHLEKFWDLCGQVGKGPCVVTGKGLLKWHPLPVTA